MAIVFITGSPGAGKSYYAVKRIVEDLKKDTNLVVSNIDGLDRAKLSFYLGREVNNLWTLDEFLATVFSFCNLHYDGNYRNAFLTILNVDYYTSGEKFREAGNLLVKSLGKEGLIIPPQTPPRR